MKPCTMENKDRFKFRVWNKKTGKYFFNADESVLLEQDGSLSILYWPDGEDSVMPADVYCGEETLVIEQCTGLRDVTGKLIYEGDIIRYNFPGTLPEIVAWNPKSCRFISHLARDFCMVFATNLGRDGDLPNFAVRIVGNVHEEKSK